MGIRYSWCSFRCQVAHTYGSEGNSSSISGFMDGSTKHRCNQCFAERALYTDYSKDWKLSGMQQHVVAYRALVSSCKLLAWFPFAVGLIQVHKD